MNRGRGGGPTPLGIVVFVVLILLLIIGVFYLVTSGGADPVVEERQETVTEATADRAVAMTVYGPIVADEERESYTITVSPDSRIVQAKKGYANRIVESKTYRNSMSAYEEFVYALEKAGYDERRVLNEDAGDDRGTCATGKRYVFEITEYGDEVDRKWTTTCNGSKGSFGGELNRVEDLFREQIPDLRDVLEPLDMR